MPAKFAKPRPVNALSRHKLPVDSVRVHILYWGVCHSDMHNSSIEYAAATNGPDIIGRVSKVGKDVVVFTSSPNKVKAALRFGADDARGNENQENIQQHIASFHALLDELALGQAGDADLMFLKSDGRLVHGQRNVGGAIKEVRQTQSFGGKHYSRAIPVECINDTFTGGTERNEAKYRFVVDAAWLP